MAKKKLKTKRKKQSKKPNKNRLAEIEDMTLNEFARAGLVLHVESKAAGEKIIFASDSKAAARIQMSARAHGTVIYLAEELAVINESDLGPESFGKIHLLKKKCQGTILMPEKTKRKDEPDVVVEVTPAMLSAAQRLQEMITGSSPQV